MMGPRFNVPTQELFNVAERGKAALVELRESVQRWNKGSA